MRMTVVLWLLTLALVPTSAARSAQTNVVGTWAFTTVSPEGTFVNDLEIRRDGDTLVAVGRSAQGERPYDSIEVNGSRIVLVITISYNGSPMTITYRGEVNGREMSGDADFGGLATGTWSAERK